ncbi:zinc-binding dehydrogenase [Phycisphaerales bacterium AB-hyl4]|uniref:Zinc-binding dehydrogenase n=1 Tax=Natronomicrosphaera hydrolytica TaxID=3242702 RepID=A0ABV4U735_9BACT
MQARSVQYGRAGGIELIDVTVSDPGPGEVQVQALACGICAWDVHVFQHGFAWDVMPGHEGVGRVVKIGPGVTGLAEGMRVTGHGLGFTEYANLPAAQLHPLPVGGHADEHWIVEPVSCVVTGLDHCQAKAGERVALVGCGFMGLLMLQGLGRSMLEQVVAIDLDAGRLALARQFGATETFNVSESDADAVAEALADRGFDTVVDTTGSQAGLNLASRLVRPGGRLNLFGWNHGTASFPGDLWHMNGITVVNSAPNAALRDPFPPAIRLIERGLLDLKPLVTHVVPLDDYPDLLATAASRNDGYIKGVVRLHHD